MNNNKPIYQYIKHFPDHKIVITPTYPITPKTQLEKQHTKIHNLFKPKHTTTPHIQTSLFNQNKQIINKINNHQRSLNRTKKLIQELTLSNNFQYFATITFNPKKTNRTNIKETNKKLKNYLKHNQNYSTKHNLSPIKYIFIPELHKDNKSIHYHGLITISKEHLINSGKTYHAKTIYNLKTFKYGFTNLTEIESQVKIASYIRKYITKGLNQTNIKQIENEKGKQRFIRSSNLNKPTVTKSIQASFKSNYFKKHITYQNKFCTIARIPLTLEQQKLQQHKTQKHNILH